MILDETTFEREYAGEKFLLRRWCMALAVRVYGRKWLSLLDSAQKDAGEVKVEAEREVSDAEAAAQEQKFFEAVVISPRILKPGETSVAGTAYTVSDLGDIAYQIAHDVMESGKRKPDFTQPSPAPEESS